MLTELNQKTEGEWEFTPPSGPDAQPAQGDDDDIDVVVWKWFGQRCDCRIGKPMLLAQCACGDDSYWFGKRRDLHPAGFQAKWHGTISFGGVSCGCLATL